jgi:hypothetical protein
MIRVRYANGEWREYPNVLAATMEATQAIVASRGYIVPVSAVEVLERDVEHKLNIRLTLVEFTREV